ncbi:hypothetical protein L1887_07708 [Cichorium endivia]|nr:hypothetical protein L1887_07708 [Cichorium endivia]
MSDPIRGDTHWASSCSEHTNSSLRPGSSFGSDPIPKQTLSNLMVTLQSTGLITSEKFGLSIRRRSGHLELSTVGIEKVNLGAIGDGSDRLDGRGIVNGDGEGVGDFNGIDDRFSSCDDSDTLELCLEEEMIVSFLWNYSNARLRCVIAGQFGGGGGG